MQLVSQWRFVRRCSCKVRGATRCNICAFFSMKASRLLQCACVCSHCYGDIARQVAERVLHGVSLKKIVAIVAENRTRFHFVQQLVQLVSQRFWPLHSMLHGAMVRETCLATALQDKLHEKLHRVTGPLFASAITIDHDGDDSLMTGKCIIVLLLWMIWNLHLCDVTKSALFVQIMKWIVLKIMKIILFNSASMESGKNV